METIVPEPTEPVREAIVAALREEPGPADGWAAAALREGVGIEGDDDVSVPGRAPFQQHDVCPLW